MTIRFAVQDDFPEVMAFYNMMCAVLGEMPFLHDGNKGGYPSEAMVRKAIRDSDLFIGTEGGTIVSAIIMNQEQDPSYGKLRWQISAPPEQIAVMHALRVSPEVSRRGYGTAMVEYCIAEAGKRGQKAIRLDTLDENTVAQKMYAKLGFRFIDTVEIFYEDIGEARTVYCYERVL
ncbi:MAG: GNAT family N-acetyltransferase [Oscillospiraceae bacterium]|nr:GNAT family N-acetyltransferase [Oscillospiraceae bacterium]